MQRIRIRPSNNMRRRYAVDTDEFIYEGDFTFEVEDLDHYVQVRYVSGWTSYAYTYRDPSGTLKVGDLVEVTTTTADKTEFAKVVALGRGSWTGPVKDVVARLARETV